MKDLYWRNHLSPRESDPVKLHGAAGSEEEREAAFTILLNAEKKAEYDAAHRALNRVGYLRRHLGLAGKAGWRGQYGDFLEPMRENNVSSSATAKGTKAWWPRILGWLLITLLLLGLLAPLAYLLLSSARQLPPL